MKITKRQLRRIIKEELQLEFLGIFDKDKVSRDSSGNVSVQKLPREEQDIYLKIKSAVKKSGRTQDAFGILKTLGVDPKDHTELVQAAMNDGKIAYSHANL